LNGDLLPPGFPIQIEIPVLPILTAQVTFINPKIGLPNINSEHFHVPDKEEGFKEGILFKKNKTDEQ